ncbi:MetQ/NlpA family ABC transporter substrate-binding protein [Cryobacterium lyxosi]|jgi:D-methionine transport system substrate-binding protein|uniref:Methionine ABC transporter substrate-binding protein n=1 Tax=Cryobacterium lyxosi TaxID=1259228 RepID=A0A4R8ZII1_9MICO|nr:MetQ/NlpA family ABC transporter substrate-binding protein [Cryobacterium lyxosi]TFD28134.1 methionine ABC transporter substrate-binding protein [Cryobacterium lyxosi]
MKKPRSLKKSVLAALAILPLAALLAGCAGAAGDDDVVKIGVVDESEPYWGVFKEAAADAGITVDLVNFATYEQPNPALTAGEIDLNQFQTIVYLANYNVASSQDLAAIGATAIYPLGLYSTQYTSVDEIQKGDTVAVPNDQSNMARALVVLQSAGLIELTDGGTISSSLDDIDTAASRVKVTALDASLTTTSLPDVAAAIVNNEFVGKAGLSFSDAIAQDDPADAKSVPYANVFAARAEDKDNATYQKLVEIYQTTKAVQDGVLEASGDTAVLLTTPVSELEASRVTVEADTKAQK